MSGNNCSCPPYEGLTYDEIIIASNLFGRGNEIKNCCEEAGYICSTLDSALKKAYIKKSVRSKPAATEVEETSKKRKVLKKRRLNV